jgi:hypothetical protein
MGHPTGVASRSNDARTGGTRPRPPYPRGDAAYGPHPQRRGTRRRVPPALSYVPPRHCPQRGVTWLGNGGKPPDSLTLCIFPLQARPRDEYSLDQAGQQVCSFVCLVCCSGKAGVHSASRVFAGSRAKSPVDSIGHQVSGLLMWCALLGGAFPFRRRPAARPGPSARWLRALRWSNGRRASHAFRSHLLTASPDHGSRFCPWCGSLVSTHHAAAPWTGASGVRHLRWVMTSPLSNGRDASPRSMACCWVTLPLLSGSGPLKTLLRCVPCRATGASACAAS